MLRKVYRQILRLKNRHQGIELSGALTAELPFSPLKTKFTGECEVGAFTYFNEGVSVSHSVIGRFCSIGSDVLINPGNHPLNWVSTHPFASDPSGISAGMSRVPEYRAIAATHARGARDSRPSTVHIGHDVWVGSRAVVMGGVEIGHGAVIGAGAVVTKSVPPYSVVAGLPARQMRLRLPQDICAQLIDLEWWNFDLSTLPGARDYSMVEEFISKFTEARAAGALKRMTPRRKSFRS